MEEELGSLEEEEKKPKRRWPMCLALSGCGCLTVIAIGIALVWWSMSFFEDTVAGHLSEEPVIGMQIGEIESIDFDIYATASAQDGSGDVLVFRIEGTRGSGQVLVPSDGMDPSTGPHPARLRMADGEVYEFDF